MSRKKVIIMGAAGKDFHIFNTCFRTREEYEVVAFTAAQIPDIEGRCYPAPLAGPLYPQGIPIESESQLAELIAKHQAAEVVFAYSDVSYEYISQKEKVVRAAGADFKLAEVERAMLPSSKPVIAICAVRTGCGKSQTTRKVAQLLRQRNKKVAVVRHPMPYGDLVAQEVQRFETLEDMERHHCTIEEMEEYEPHIAEGSVVFAGVDYAKILQAAEKEADYILWDGGNNDIPFFKPNLHITLVATLRPGHEINYYPGKINFEMADVLLFNKMDSATAEQVDQIMNNVQKINPEATIIKANSVLEVDHPELIKGKKVLVVEDGPTLTHGGMRIGAGIVAAQRYEAAEIVDPRPWLQGKIVETFKTYPEIGALLPAMGYGEQQKQDLMATINACECDVVVIGTPIDLSRIIKIDKPTVRVKYSLAEIGKPDLAAVLQKV